MPRIPEHTSRTTCFSPAAAPCPDAAAPPRRGNVVRLSDLPRATQGRIATRLAGSSSGHRVPRQAGGQRGR